MAEEWLFPSRPWEATQELRVWLTTSQARAAMCIWSRQLAWERETVPLENQLGVHYKSLLVLHLIRMCSWEVWFTAPRPSPRAGLISEPRRPPKPRAGNCVWGLLRNEGLNHKVCTLGETPSPGGGLYLGQDNCVSPGALDTHAEDEGRFSIEQRHHEQQCTCFKRTCTYMKTKKVCTFFVNCK